VLQLLQCGIYPLATWTPPVKKIVLLVDMGIPAAAMAAEFPNEWKQLILRPAWH
jgi:hypothetical protein